MQVSARTCAADAMHLIAADVIHLIAADAIHLIAADAIHLTHAILPCVVSAARARVCPIVLLFAPWCCLPHCVAADLAKQLTAWRHRESRRV